MTDTSQSNIAIERYENGNIKTKSGHNAFGRFKNEYDQNGHILSRTQDDSNNELKTKWKYDASGELKSKTEYGFNQLPLSRETFDKNHTLIRTILCSSLGTPWRITEFYDDGTIKKRIQFDENGKSSQKTNYAPEGSLIRKVEYKDGKIASVFADIVLIGNNRPAFLRQASNAQRQR